MRVFVYTSMHGRLEVIYCINTNLTVAVTEVLSECGTSCSKSPELLGYTIYTIGSSLTGFHKNWHCVMKVDGYYNFLEAINLFRQHGSGRGGKAV